MSPQRIQRKRTAGWRMPENAVYVGRSRHRLYGRWGNPYTPANVTVVTDMTTGATRPATVAECVEMYRREITCSADDCAGDHRWTEGLDPRELAGKDLACWCALSQPCHADVLLEIANEEQPHA